MITLAASPFVEETCELGEGPFWWQERLWWVDIDAGQLHAADDAGQKRQSFSVGQKLGAAAPVADGTFVVAVEEGVGTFDPKNSRLEILHRPEQGIEGSRFNDGKCDPAGRFLAGTLNRHGRKQGAALYALDRDWSFRKTYAPVTLSNGLAWSSDGGTLYFIDTPTLEVAAFAYDIRSGQLGERRTAVRIPPQMGWPDGMTIDTEGNLWIAHWGDSTVRCWCPSTGKCLAKISVPCSQPTSCCFGGGNLASLFITTARQSENLEKHPKAGGIFVCQPGASGLPTVPFAGRRRTN